MTISEKLQLLKLVENKHRYEVHKMLQNAILVASAMNFSGDFVSDESPKKQTSPSEELSEQNHFVPCSVDCDCEDVCEKQEYDEKVDVLEDKCDECICAPEESCEIPEKFVPRLRKFLDKAYEKQDPLRKLYAEKVAISDAVRAKLVAKLELLFREIDEELGIESPVETAVKDKTPDTLESLVIEKMNGVKWPEAKPEKSARPLPEPTNILYKTKGVPLIGTGYPYKDEEVLKESITAPKDTKEYVTAEEVAFLVKPSPSLQIQSSAPINSKAVPIDLKSADAANEQRMQKILAEIEHLRKKMDGKPESSVTYF